jgi:F-type H+-transporting ATPase subunit b
MALPAVTIFAASEGGGSDSGSFLVSPNVGLMIWTLIVFAISFYILAKVAFPRIQEALDKRQRAIEESIDYAEHTRQQADELLVEYRARLAEARNQADEIVSRARKTGEATEAESVADGKRKRDELIDQARREIDQETHRALQELRGQVADLTVLATEKVTRKSLTSDDQRKLVDDAVSELDFAALSGDHGGAR